MELLLILTYTAICYAIFKIFRIPLNKWSIPTAVLGGVVLIALILLVMNYNHPFTKQARLYFYTTPIVPVVRGEVVEVPVRPNLPLKAGDVLFRIDPRPYQYVVDQKRAALAEAEQNVLQLKAALDAARGGLAEAVAARDRSQQAFERFEQGNANARRANRSAPFAEIEVENRRGMYLGSEAAVASAQANAEQARLAYEAEIDGVNTTVARLQAELRSAEYDLTETTVTAPTDGYVTQLFLRPGMIAVPLPLRPVMVFVHGEGNIFVAAFPQNALQRVRAGDEAEVAFDGVPGRDLQGRGHRRHRRRGAGPAAADGCPARPRGARAAERRPGAGADRHHRRPLRLSASGRLGGAGGGVHRALAPLRHHPAHPAADEELAELRVPGGALGERRERDRRAQGRSWQYRPGGTG